jgi:hypothetical protein
MAAAAHDADFAAKVGIPQAVAKEFFRADQRQKRRGSIRKSMQKTRTKGP